MGAASAISTLTLPVPAPTSHRVSVGATASLASAAARTSCLVIGTAPKPAAARISHSAAGLVLRPPVKKKVGRALRHSAAGAQAHPWALTRCQFCHGLPSAAANSCTLEIPGSTVTSAPCARSLGTSAAAPE